VTREYNNPTAAHAGCKRQPKWVPSAWGKAGPPCPVAYKYGVLPLQVGDWVTGQQLGTVKNSNSLETQIVASEQS